VQEGRPQEEQVAAGWSGVMSLPRIVTLRDDGLLAFAPAPELEQLRGAHTVLAGMPLPADTELPIPQIAGDTLEIIAELRVGDAEECGITLRRSPGGEEATRIVYDRLSETLTIDARQARSDRTEGCDLRGGSIVLEEGILQLHIFLDRSVIEVFANETVCITGRIYPARPDSLGVALFARGGTAELLRLDAWPIP
jgi:beta-fructofuranosidase